MPDHLCPTCAGCEKPETRERHAVTHCHEWREKPMVLGEEAIRMALQMAQWPTLASGTVCRVRGGVFDNLLGPGWPHA